MLSAILFRKNLGLLDEAQIQFALSRVYLTKRRFNLRRAILMQNKFALRIHSTFFEKIIFKIICRMFKNVPRKSQRNLKLR